MLTVTKQRLYRMVKPMAMYTYLESKSFRSISATPCDPVGVAGVLNAVPIAGNAPTFPAGSTVTYECTQGYTMFGLRNHVTCLVDGSWSVPQMKCIGKLSEIKKSRNIIVDNIII